MFLTHGVYKNETA